jgi:hypothetical protein
LAVALLEVLTNESKADVLVDESQQVVFGEVFFQLEVVEQGCGTGFSHHDQQASRIKTRRYMEGMLPCIASYLL